MDEKEFPVLNSFNSHRRWDIESSSSKKCSCHLNYTPDLESFTNILDKITTSMITTITSALQQTTTSIISTLMQMQFSSTDSISSVFSSLPSPSNMFNPVQCLSNSVRTDTKSSSITPVTNSHQKSKSNSRKSTNKKATRSNNLSDQTTTISMESVNSLHLSS